ncbi:MAG: HAD-IC family P-type ATPase [Lachnospiraceae bacterium]|nr:HAD-IC family P-type ATPase [bacterium]MDY5516546.1 HAD-IC family P-type ATPase [Lachnospiraceae bacterium]
MVGSFRDLTFLIVIIANSVIGIVQELHAKKVLDDLSLVGRAKVTTIRDGARVELDSEELVLDDMVVLSAGCQIPADAILQRGSVSVNESLLTGESDEIVKRPGDELLSGSFIVSGECIARLDQVGADSYISKLTLQATKSKDGEQSEMIRALNRLVQVVGILIIPIGITLFVQQYVISGNDLKNSVTGMVASVLGMIPEGLYLMATVAMAVSATRLATRQVLIHNMKCIETLARVNVLCVDKTGTITEPRMTVHAVLPMLDTYDGRATGEWLAAFVGAQAVDNITMEALQEYFADASVRLHADTVQGFSSKTKYSGVQFGANCFVLGAPEFVLREDYAAQAELIEEHSRAGYRVLVFAAYDGTLQGEALTERATTLAYVLLSNPIREGAKETFAYFARQGVEVRVISGDNPVTVSEVAAQAGIANAGRYIDASTLKTPEDIASAATKYVVFGRVTPDQKRALVQAMKAKGETVAMTGDGVNDVLALKDADCSIAMASGSEAASQVAQLVLMDSDFSRMPAVVMEGRRVVNNIERTASLFLVKNIFSMLLSIFSVCMVLEYPLEPAQISLISMFTIGIPGFIMSLEPNKERIRGRFLSKVILKALPAGLTDFLVVSAMVIFCREFAVNAADVSTACTVIVAIVGFMILYRIASPMTKAHWIMLVGVITGWLFCVIEISHLFAINSISKQCAMLLIVFAMLTEPLLRYLSLLVEKANALYRRMYTKWRNSHKKE